jgi:hypothetical protein
MFLLQVIVSSVQQTAFATWKDAVVVVFSLVSIEIVLSSKTLLAYSTGIAGADPGGGAPKIGKK